MRTMHLFAGVGGGLLADLILGHTPVIAVEWDGYACQVLRERAKDGWFPNLSVWEGDIRLFDPSEYARKVDCIHAGFPCQDISVAGNQAGVGHETRSGLYREVLRIAGIVRPRYLFLENVSAILGNGLGTVLADLATMGFSAEWGCIRASDCGAPHHRDRWFALCTSNTNGSNGSPKQEREHKWTEESCGSRTREVGSLLADADGSRRQGYWNGTERREQKYTEPGISSWWEVESGLGQLVDGVSNRVCESGEEINANATKNTSRQDLQNVREGIQPESNAKRTQAGCEAISEAEVLQSVMCEHAGNNDIDCARVFVQGEEASEELLRGLRLHKGASRAPHRSRQDEQRTGEHSDALQALPQLLAHGTKENEQGNSWPDAFVGYWDCEPDIGRVTTGISNRVGQLKGYGNAQVPLQAAVAWKLLGGE